MNKILQKKCVDILKILEKDNPSFFYIVGGFLRNYMLGRQSYDIDLIGKGNIFPKVKDFCKKIRATIVTLDEERRIYRVIKKIKNKEITFDFSSFEGNSLYEDLKNRDFTINTFALLLKDVFSPFKNKIIDPFNGKKDLDKKQIKIVSQLSLMKDPLRILRAYRLEGILNFKIEENTNRILKREIPNIKNVSNERIRDEFFKILSTEKSYKYLYIFQKNLLLETLFPQIKVMYDKRPYYYHKGGLWEHSIETVKSLENIFSNLNVYFPRVYKKIANYLEEDISQHITRKTLLKWSGFLHDIGKPQTAKIINGKMRFFGHQNVGVKIAKEICKQLKLSNKAIKFITSTIYQHMRPGTLSEVGFVTKRALYRYFRDLKEEGVTTLILSLADRLSYKNVRKKELKIENHKTIIRKMVYYYLLKKSSLELKPLLNGYEIMENFNIPSSPLVGRLLDVLKEAQSTGAVKTKKQAICFLKKKIRNKN